MAGVIDIAAAVRAGRQTAADITRASLDRIRARDSSINAFTAVVADRAAAAAARIDNLVRSGRDPGPLAGVSFAVKNLFDIEGITTIAGSRIDAVGTDAELTARRRSSTTPAGRSRPRS